MIRSLLMAGTVLVTGAVAVIGPSTPVAADGEPWSIPVRPPRCTIDQALTGDVADCVVAFGKDAHEDGWGTPPSPGVGTGWTWNNHTYSGSPALATWESDEITSNDDRLAGFGPGYFEFNTGAQVLFEGFLREISAGGYEVRHATGYTFRCTAGSGGWSCPSGRIEDLSLHAYGLALDMNSIANPIKSYSGTDGGSACATPIETDMPRWVIRTAERWGLYWGGYGWSGGCIDADTNRSVVFRDPPHFEFSGTPEMARAIARHNLGDAFVGVCIDVVDDAGDDAERCNLSGRPEAGWRIPVELDVPEGSTAAMVNVAVTDSTARGHVTLEDCEARSGPRDTAALTFAAGQTVATMAVVPVFDDGRFCVYSNADVHRIVDVIAYLADDPATQPAAPESADGATTPDDAASSDDGSARSSAGPSSDDLVDQAAIELGSQALRFQPTTPTRLVDTRGVGEPVRHGGTHTVDGGAAPRLANVAATESVARGYLQAGACGSLGPEAGFSNLNYPASSTRSNLAFVRGGDKGTCVFALSRTHLVVDELGRFDPDTGLGWDLGSSGRLLDTRECATVWCGDRPGAGNVMRVTVGTDADAIVVAITATESIDRGYVWAGPCSVLAGRDRPPTSNLNHAAGQTTTNLAIVALENGEMCIYNRAPGHIVVDLQAELTETAAVGVVPIEPLRIHDSRP